MVEVFGLMMLLGGFSFLGFGICLANSIEAHENEIIGRLLTILTFSGMISFIIGLIGLISCS